MKIKELTKKERDKLIDILKEDGFVDIKDSGNLISFRKGIRLYELKKVGMDEESLSIDFDFDKFMEDNYELKTRHSISFSDKFYESGSVEGSCKKLKWKITKGPFSITQDEDWKVDLYGQQITEVLIGKLIHTIVDDKVYTGNAEELLYMGKISAEDLLSGTKISKYLQN